MFQNLLHIAAHPETDRFYPFSFLTSDLSIIILSDRLGVLQKPENRTAGMFRRTVPDSSTAGQGRLIVSYVR